MRTAGSDALVAAIGVGICGRCYEVGDDVIDAADPILRGDCVVARNGRWLFDLPAYVGGVLEALDVDIAVREGHCAYHDDAFYSYRRDGQTGRFATLAWLTDGDG